MMKPLFLVFIVALISSSVTFYFSQQRFVANLEASLEELYESKALVLEPGIINQFQALKAEAEAELAELERIKADGHKVGETLDAILEAQAVKFALVSVQTGMEKVHSRDFPALLEPNGCEANRGLIDKKVYFEQPFKAPPQVITSFAMLDFRDGRDARVRMEVKEVTKEYFSFDLATWCDTKTSQIAATWLAVGI